jgi:TonB family protein
MALAVQISTGAVDWPPVSPGHRGFQFQETFQPQLVFAPTSTFSNDRVNATMGYSVSQTSLFSLLPKTRAPWPEFAFGSGMQAAAIAVLVGVRLLYPAVVTTPEHNFRSIELVSTPVAVNHQPQPLVPLTAANLEMPENAIRLAAPESKLPARVPEKVEDAIAPAVSVTFRKPELLPPNSAPVIPKQGVKTNVFSTGSSLPATVANPDSQVQTGGFGDPNGIPAKAGQNRAVTIAANGSFDLPSGSGYGNGMGGPRGVVGTAVSSGFGDATSTPFHAAASTGSVRASGFAAADLPAPPAGRSQPAESVSRVVPAEILSKPTPVYTQEARNLRIQGEVLLEIVLEASGSVHVARLVRGLGHGLDDNAIRAAEQIHFKPAMKDGQPADSTVVLHIIFQLA